MKKYLVILLAILALIPVHTLASSVDLSGMTIAELESLQQQVQQQLKVLKSEGGASIDIGETSRRTPATKHQEAHMEMDMYGEYTYAMSITLNDFQVTGGKSILTFNLSIGACSDGVDREINIWNTDFSVYSPEGTEKITSAKNVYFAGKEPGVSWNISMYPESEAQFCILFEEDISNDLLRFEVMNKYKFKDTDRPKSSVWFAPGK